MGSQVSQPESGDSSDDAELPSTVTKQSSISPVGGVSTAGQVGGSNSGLVNSPPSNNLHKSSAMTYDTAANKTTVTASGNNGKKGMLKDI